MIITKDEISALCRPCSTDEDAAKNLIREAEMLDVAPQIGQKLYDAVNATPTDFTDLLNGCSFTDENGKTVYHQGLKRIVAYYASARIIRSSNCVMTRYGYVVKQNDTSMPADVQRVVNDSNYLRNVAEQMIEQLKLYIKAVSNTTLYSNLVEEKDNATLKGGFIDCDLIGD